MVLGAKRDLTRGRVMTRAISCWRLIRESRVRYGDSGKETSVYSVTSCFPSVGIIPPTSASCSFLIDHRRFTTSPFDIVVK